MYKRLLSIIKKTLRILIPLSLGLFVLWLVYRKTNFSEITDVWRSGVHFGIICISLFFGLFANIIRAFRWNLLIRSLGENPRKSNLVCAVLGNYAVNYALPRLGEVWRCGVVAKYEKISFTKLIGTLLIDRLADTITVGLIVLVCFGLNIPFFKSYFEKNPEILQTIENYLTSPWLYISVILILVFIWTIFRYLGHLKLVGKAKGTLLNVWIGIKTVKHIENKWAFLFYTILIWGGYFLYFYICFFAFDFTENLGWKDGLTAFGISSVSVAIPVPGGVGVWHAAVSGCLAGFGVNAVNAKSFAFIVYLIQNLFTAIVGILGMLALPVINKKKKEINQTILK